MFDIDKVLSEINKQQEYMNILLISLKEDFFKNTKIDLNKRWDVFTELYRKGIYKSTQLYGNGFIKILSQEDDLSMYDDFYVERHQTVNYVDMYNTIREDMNIKQEFIDEWREAVLESGDTSFIYDW